MNVGSDVLEYASPYEPVPLSELEEALLCVAGTGLTGLNLGDLDPARGMSTLVQWTTRTWPSSCSNHGTELFFTNDDGLYMLRMFDELPEPGEVATLSGKPLEAQVDWLLDMYRRARVELQPGPRAAADRRCRASSTSTSGTPTSRGRPSSSRSPTPPSSTSTCCSSTSRAATASRWWTSSTAAARRGCSRPSTRAASTRRARWASSSWSSACCRCWWSSRRSSARTSTSPCRRWAWAAGPSPATSPASCMGGGDVPGLGFRFARGRRRHERTRWAATASSRRSPRRTTPTCTRPSTTSWR